MYFTNVLITVSVRKQYHRISAVSNERRINGKSYTPGFKMINVVVQYVLIFNTHDERTKFFLFLKIDSLENNAAIQ